MRFKIGLAYIGMVLETGFTIEVTDSVSFPLEIDRETSVAGYNYEELPKMIMNSSLQFMITSMK